MPTHVLPGKKFSFLVMVLRKPDVRRSCGPHARSGGAVRIYRAETQEVAFLSFLDNVTTNPNTQPSLPSLTPFSHYRVLRVIPGPAAP
jgi:hypothetical protein